MHIQPLGKHDGFVAIPHRQMVARLETIPLEPRLKEDFYKSFHTWCNSSGPTWSVDRTKALRDCIMQSRAQGGLSHKPDWVSTTKAGNLRGLYGRLYGVAQTSYKGFRAVLNLLNIYSVWTRTTLDLITRTEIVNEINQSPTVVSNSGSPGSKQMRKLHALWHSKGSAFNHNPGLKRPTRVKCKHATPLAQVLPGKKSHVALLGIDLYRIKNSMPYILHPVAIRQGLGGCLIEDNPAYNVQHWTSIAQQQGYTDSEIESIVSDVTSPNPVLRLVTEANVGNMSKNHVGRLNYSYEPGLKVRYFAAPNQVIQRALEPLKDGLFRVLKRLPWDCTFHQQKADGFIISAMRAGRTVHTVDMSKATDNFPWEYQKSVLNMVINTRDPYTRDVVGLLIDTVERGYWQMDGGRNLRKLTWSKGQPLGLGPSFPLFALTHGLVLFSLNEGRWDQKFFVLGDDVIILDDDLAVRYKKWLSTVDIKISTAKTFSSSEVGQFAGKTYTPQGSFWVPKWKEFTKDNVLDICSWWYPGLSAVFPKDRKLIDRVLSLPAPFGNGWNPDGLSFDDRLTDDIIDAMLEREKLNEEKSSPTSIDCRTSRIRTALKEAGLDDECVKDAVGFRVEEHRATRYSNRVTTSIPPELYAPETEVPGYPLRRFRGVKVDPYSKGTLHSWKSMFAPRPKGQD